MSSKNGVSVIICCYNSAQRIKPTLEHLINQKVSEDLSWELLIIDNNSSDTTSLVSREILEQSSCKNYSIICEKRQGLSIARRTGFENSKYDLLLFVDDDNWLDETYIQNAYETMTKNDDFGVLGGKGSPVFPDSKNVPFWFNEFKESYAVGEQSETLTNPIQIVSLVYGAGFMIKKALWKMLLDLGFESLLPDRKGKALLSGGDTELCIAISMLGKQIAYSSDLTFKHYIPQERLSWDYLSKLYFGFGRAKVYIEIYSYCQSNTINPQNNYTLPLWIDRSIHLIKGIIRYKTMNHLWFVNRNNKTGDSKYLTLHGLQGELFELLSIRSNINDKYNQVITLKGKIRDRRVDNSTVIKG
jgi:glycosyltransferase involved in cell wall biosynthesis